MSYEERLQNVAVIGAAGKMGSGIVLLTALELADLALASGQSNEYVLNAIDISSAALKGLMKYLRDQVKRAAEKKVVALRNIYKNRQDLVENEEFIDQYIEDVLAVVHPSTHMESAFDATLIFEAIVENADVKVKLLSAIKQSNRHDPWIFTNTSSIPISELDDRIGLDGKVIGFHFYNPPAVQKLVEIITSSKTRPEVLEFAQKYASKLRKIVVPSNDVPGFIGNGFFMRDILYAISEVERICKDFTFAESVYIINKISQDFLVRPMGIFQLIDYVGLDVCTCILNVMDSRIPGEELKSRLLDRLISLGVKGGQNPDGSQKDGILKYEKGQPVAVYDPDSKSYLKIADFAQAADAKLGPLPSPALPWKVAVRDAAKDQLLTQFFSSLKSMNTLGADLAARYGHQAKLIGQGLVNGKIALSDEDVNKVMLTGFFHSYGPINSYFD